MNIKRYSTWHWIPTERIKGEIWSYQLPWQGKVRQGQGFVIHKNVNSGVCNEGGYFSSLGSVNRIYYLSVLPILNTDTNFHAHVLYACIAVYLCRVSSFLSESSYSLQNDLQISRPDNSSVSSDSRTQFLVLMFATLSYVKMTYVYSIGEYGLNILNQDSFLNCISPAFCF